MSSKLNKASYQGLVDGDIEWLKSQEDCPENWHIQQIVKGSVDYYYPESKAETLPISGVRLLSASEGDLFRIHITKAERGVVFSIYDEHGLLVSNVTDSKEFINGLQKLIADEA
jgi:hypothetical protein